MTIFVSGSSALISRVASRPLHGDIPMSIRTRSGVEPARQLERLEAVARLADDLHPPRPAAGSRCPARKRAWSSASRTRMRHLLALGQRHVHGDASCPAPGLDDELEAAADRLRALAHRLQAEARPTGPDRAAPGRSRGRRRRPRPRAASPSTSTTDRRRRAAPACLRTLLSASWTIRTSWISVAGGERDASAPVVDALSSTAQPGHAPQPARGSRGGSGTSPSRGRRAGPRIASRTSRVDVPRDGSSIASSSDVASSEPSETRGAS